MHNKSYETLSSGDNHLQCFTLLKEKLLEFLIGIQINNNDYYDYIENPVNYTIHLQLTDIIKPGRAVNAVTYHTTRLIQDGFILEPANPPTIVTIIVSNSLNPSFNDSRARLKNIGGDQVNVGSIRAKMFGEKYGAWKRTGRITDKPKWISYLNLGTRGNIDENMLKLRNLAEVIIYFKISISIFN